MTDTNKAISKMVAINELHEYLNNVVPTILERLRFPIRFKADSQPYKKEAMEIKAIIDSVVKPKGSNVWIKWDKYSVWLISKIYFSDGVGSCIYNKDIYLGDSKSFISEFIPLKENYNIDALLKVVSNIRQLKEQKKTIETSIELATKHYDSFFDTRNNCVYELEGV